MAHSVLSHFLLLSYSSPPFTPSPSSFSKSLKEPLSCYRFNSGLPTTRKEFRCNCCSLWASQAQPSARDSLSSISVETFYDGYLAAIMVEEGGVAAVGSPIALLAETEDEIDQAKSKANSSSSSSSAPPPAAELATSSAEPQSEKIADNAGPTSAAKAAPSVVGASTHPASEGGKRIVASPYAKKLAKELKVELGRIVGTGPLGSIVAKDVEAAAASAAPASSPRGVDSAATVPWKSAGIELGSVVPFTTMQSAIKSKGVTMTALLAKATALALVKHPVINSSCRDGKSFTYNSSINIAVAVAIDGGLLTPFLQDADKVDIYSLSRKWKELADKAWAKQLQPHEYNTANDITIEDLEDAGRSSRWVSTFLFGQILSMISPLVAYASDTLKTNEIYEIGELFDLGIQLLYLLLLLCLLGVGSYFVIRQVLVRRELDLSAKELQEQVRSGDASATELFELGAVMLRRKFYPAATKYLLQAIEKWDGDDQDLAQVYNALGVSYVREEKLDKGIAQFETAVKLQPGYVTAWNNLGDAYEKKKEYKAALRAFEEVLLFDPNNKVARPRRDAMKERVEMYKGVPVKSKER